MVKTWSINWTKWWLKFSLGINQKIHQSTMGILKLKRIWITTLSNQSILHLLMVIQHISGSFITHRLKLQELKVQRVCSNKTVLGISNSTSFIKSTMLLLKRILLIIILKNLVVKSTLEIPSRISNRWESRMNNTNLTDSKNRLKNFSSEPKIIMGLISILWSRVRQNLCKIEKEIKTK